MTIDLTKKKTGQEVRVHNLVPRTSTLASGKGSGNEARESTHDN